MMEYIASSFILLILLILKSMHFRRRVCVFFSSPHLFLSFIYFYFLFLFLYCVLGDHYDQGRVRSKELWESCHLLGVSRENILLYRCDDLPDNPSIVWPTVRTANLINQYLHALDIDMVQYFYVTSFVFYL